MLRKDWKNSAKDVVTTVSLSENELAGMQYLAGYVLQSLHKKHRTSKHKATTESQQAISILTACRLQDNGVLQLKHKPYSRRLNSISDKIQERLDN